MNNDEHYTPEAMERDQAEQGLAEQEHDDDLRRIISKLIWLDNMAEGDTGLRAGDFKTLCQACGIDVRDVT